jgi:hypothetical protein
MTTVENAMARLNLSDEEWESLPPQVREALEVPTPFVYIVDRDGELDVFADYEKACEAAMLAHPHGSVNDTVVEQAILAGYNADALIADLREERA